MSPSAVGGGGGSLMSPSSMGMPMASPSSSIMTPMNATTPYANNTNTNVSSPAVAAVAATGERKGS
jgi:hypothetical protein